MLTDKLLLTVPEGASVLGVGRSFLYDLVRRGVVKSVKLGRARRIPVAELEAYAKRLLEEQEGEGR